MQTPLSVLLSDKGHDLHTTTPQTTVFDSVLKMNHLGVGALLVMEDNELRGIISERDITRKLVGCKCDPAEVLTGEIMTKDLVTVLPTTTVQEAMRIVTERRFRHLPVLENGKLIGLISIGDLTRWVMLQQEGEIDALTHYIHGEH